MNTSERKALRPRAPLTPSQAALHVRPFGVGEWAVDPVRGRLMAPDKGPVALSPDTMLVLVMLAAEAGSPVCETTIGATLWPDDDDPGPAVAHAAETLRGHLGQEAIVKSESGYTLTPRVSIDANDSGFWLSKSEPDEPAPPEPVTSSTLRLPTWNPIFVMPIAVVVLLLVLFLLR